MRTRISACVLAAALCAQVASALQDSDRREFPFVVLDANAQRLVLEPLLEQLDRISNLRALELQLVPLPDGSLVQLDLRRLDLGDLRLGVRFDDEPAPDALLATGLSLWTGVVHGTSDSSVFLALSRFGCRGWIQQAGETLHLLAQPALDGSWTNSTCLLSTEAGLSALGEQSVFECAAGAPPGGAAPPPPNPEGGPGTLLECRVAIEGDYQLFQRFNSASAELSYVVALLGAVSSRYHEQLDVVLTYPYLNLWTVPGDPWSAQDQGGGTQAVLDEFRMAWDNGHIPANANVAHMLSGADLGGGRAYLNVLCNSQWGFGVSGNLTHFGQLTLPVTQGPLTWDFVVAAHELGHNFSAEHTHVLCPPLDRCAPSAFFGPCQSSQVCSSQGTLMSYCHQCPGGLSNITTVFHAAQIGGMRSAAQNSCLSSYAVYVNCSWNGAESGTFNNPFDTVAEAVQAVPSGRWIVLKASTCNASPITIDKALTLGSTGGTSRIE